MARQSAYNTKLKKTVAGIFTDNEGATYSAREVYEILTGRGESVNLTTVYRNLEAMSNEGFLLKNQDIDGEKTLFSYAGERGICREHLHLRCLVCGKMEHLDCCFMDQLREHIMSEHGFSLKCDKSTLFGVCSVCCEKGSLHA